MPSTAILKTLGLKTSPNALNSQEGGLSEATNVIIRRDDVIEPRRGFKLYGDSLGTSSSRAKQLAVYRDRILRHYDNTLDFDDGEGNFTSFSGSFSEAESGLRIKSVLANGNFYFTTSEGIKKISAATADELSSSSNFITQAGGIKAIDFTGKVNYSNGNLSSFLTVNSAVAYRVVWGIRDANNNLILGTPSSRTEIFNSFLSFLLRDYSLLLSGLDYVSNEADTPPNDDYGSLIDDANYVSSLVLSSSASANDLKEKIIDLSEKLDADIVYADNDDVVDSAGNSTAPLEIDTFTEPAPGVYRITFTSSNVMDFFIAGQKIFLAGFTAVNGIKTIASVAATYIEFNDTAAQSVVLTGNETVKSYKYQQITKVDVLTKLDTFTIDSPPTTAQLTQLQTTLSAILTTLQNEPVGVISNRLRNAFLDSLDVTDAATVTLTIPVPQDVTENHFVQIYRSGVTTASGATPLNDIVPSDELQLVYEAFLTPQELEDRLVVVEDITFDDFRGANLYTNAISGEGILQANDIPPFAKDINTFKNFTFYANTRTRHRKTFNLISVEDLLDELKTGKTPKLTIANENTSHTYDFITGSKEKTDINLVSVASIVGKYFNINSANNSSKYYVFYNKGISSITTGASTTITTNGNHNLTTGDQVTLYATDISPTLDGTHTVTVTGATTFTIPVNTTVGYIVGTSSIKGRWIKVISGRNGLRVDLNTTDTPTLAAQKTNSILKSLIGDFTTSISGTTVTVENVEVGYTDDTEHVTTTPSDLTISIITQGTGERATQEMTFISNISAGAALTTGSAGKYFTLNSAYNRNQYYIWYNTGTESDPAIAGKTGIRVDVSTLDTATTVANKTRDELNDLDDKFIAESSSDTLTITNFDFGPANDATAGTSGFTIEISQQGSLEIIVSQAISLGQAVDETARNIIRVVNKNNKELIYGFYLSGSDDVPGKILFEERTLTEEEFYLIANNTLIGQSFNPTLEPASSVISTPGTISAANPTVITVNNHGLVDGDAVLITNSNSTPNIDGIHIVSNVSTNTFTIPISVTTAGNQVSLIYLGDAESSENEKKIHRIYFSKLQQPEAVPIVNFFDVGSENKAILRIFPLRDSLFVFKEDGLYRVSGETSPFNVALFDTSFILLAPDSVDVANNQIYGWTTQGISTASESGINIISRDIDVDILPLQTFPNFKTATWGKGYESDNSYLMFTIQQTSDQVATIAYRYSNLTNSWTTFDKTNTCGIVHPVDDKLYMGAGDTNFIEQERKGFNRLDYADREFITTLTATDRFVNNGEQIILNDVSNFKVGDVLVQEQFLTTFEFNLLLKKLDMDPGIIDINYFSTLEAAGGSNLRTKILELAAKLDLDTGVNDTNYEDTITTKASTIAPFPTITAISATNPTVITTSAAHGLVSKRIVVISGSNSVPNIDGVHEVTVLSPTTFSIDVAVLTAGTSGTFTTSDNDFRDIKACYNAIITKLNADSGVVFANYRECDTTTLQESIITAINVITKVITLNIKLPYVIGPLTVFQSIETSFTYLPNIMGDPIGYKHIREATVIFEDQTFTSATLSFATDLLPAFISVPIIGTGSGIFGHQSHGTNFFGGKGNSVPFRTYIPRNCQRCRYLVVKFSHSVAREKWSIFGHSLTGEVGLSSRAYR